MARSQLLESRPVELIGLDHRDATCRDRDERGRPDPALEVCPLAEERTGPVLGQALPVAFDPDDAVEDQRHLRARLALGHEHAALAG